MQCGIGQSHARTIALMAPGKDIKGAKEIMDIESTTCREICDKAVLDKDPLVSAAMITYNHAPYIADAIEGILQQETNFPFELVIGEDCSTDGTREIVLNYQKKYPDIIKIITSDKNVGSCKNTVRTERACRGKYIAYCEGDDYWHHPLKLQKQIDFLETHPDYGLVHSDIKRYNVTTGQTTESSNRYLKRQKHISDNGDPNLVFKILIRTYGIATCTVCVRKKLLDCVIESDPVAFQSDRFVADDIPRWIELSRLTKLKFMDGEPLVTYRLLPESLTRSRNIRKRMKYILSGFEMTLYYADKYGCTDKLPKSRLDHYTYPLLSYAYCYRDTELAAKVKAMRTHLPFGQRLLYWASVHHVARLLLWPLVWPLVNVKRVIGKFADILRQ
ncbi:glycosyltransferase [Planctomycetota bacterium]